MERESFYKKIGDEMVSVSVLTEYTDLFEELTMRMGFGREMPLPDGWYRLSDPIDFCLPKWWMNRPVVVKECVPSFPLQEPHDSLSFHVVDESR